MSIIITTGNLQYRLEESRRLLLARDYSWTVTPVVAGLLIRKAVTWKIPYLEYQMAMNTEGSHVADSVRIPSAIVAICL